MELGKPLLLQIGAHPKLKHCAPTRNLSIAQCAMLKFRVGTYLEQSWRSPTTTAICLCRDLSSTCYALGAAPLPRPRASSERFGQRAAQRRKSRVQRARLVQPGRCLPLRCWLRGGSLRGDGLRSGLLWPRHVQGGQLLVRLRLGGTRMRLAPLPV